MSNTNNSNIQVHFSAKSPVWATPAGVFNELNREFKFNLDVCALPENTKCGKFFSPEQDGLKQSWAGFTGFCNPPYGREIADWVQKAVHETVFSPSFSGSKNPQTVVVMLIPARTDTKWWHNYVMSYAKEVRFVKGRIKFEGAESSAPFPNCIVVFDSSHSCGHGPEFSSIAF